MTKIHKIILLTFSKISLLKRRKQNQVSRCRIYLATRGNPHQKGKSHVRYLMELRGQVILFTMKKMKLRAVTSANIHSEATTTKRI